MKLKVAACQILTYPSPEKSAAKIAGWIKKAAAAGIDIVAFPEAALAGYACSETYWKKADPRAFRAAEKKLMRTAARCEIAVILGTAHWENGRLFNSVLAIDKDGRAAGRYSKTHLAEDWPNPGRTLPVVRIAGVDACFIVCHDIRYPELVRLPAIRGARICFFCTNESGLTHERKLSAYRAMPIARAAENSIFLVMANAPADPDRIDARNQSHGNSKIVHPDGNVLSEAGFFEERLVTADIDVSDADGIFAQRAATDDTILRSWMNEGANLVINVESD